MSKEVQVTRLPLTSDEAFVRNIFKDLAARIRAVRLLGPRPGHHDRFKAAFVTLASASDAADAVLRFDQAPYMGGVVKLKLAPSHEVPHEEVPARVARAVPAPPPPSSSSSCVPVPVPFTRRGVTPGGPTETRMMCIGRGRMTSVRASLSRDPEVPVGLSRESEVPAGLSRDSEVPAAQETDTELKRLRKELGELRMANEQMRKHDVDADLKELAETMHKIRQQRVKNKTAWADRSLDEAASIVRDVEKTFGDFSDLRRSYKSTSSIGPFLRALTESDADQDIVEASVRATLPALVDTVGKFLDTWPKAKLEKFEKKLSEVIKTLAKRCPGGTGQMKKSDDFDEECAFAPLKMASISMLTNRSLNSVASALTRINDVFRQAMQPDEEGKLESTMTIPALRYPVDEALQAARNEMAAAMQVSPDQIFRRKAGDLPERLRFQLDIVSELLRNYSEIVLLAEQMEAEHGVVIFGRSVRAQEDDKSHVAAEEVVPVEGQDGEEIPNEVYEEEEAEQSNQQGEWQYEGAHAYSDTKGGEAAAVLSKNFAQMALADRESEEDHLSDDLFGSDEE